MSKIVEDEKPDKIDRYFGSVEIEGKTCGVEDCDSTPVAVYPILTPEAGTGVWWFCQEHAETFLANCPMDGNAYLAEVSRTCRAGTDESPCGAFATGIVIVGVKNESGQKRLSAVSVCGRHAERLGTE